MFACVLFGVSVSAADWPLAGLTRLTSKGVSTETFAAAGKNSTITKPFAEDFSFTAGPPHCDYKHRIEYIGTSGTITVTDPEKNTATTTAFFNSSATGQTCHVSGPIPIPAGQCVNPYAELGQNFSFEGTAPCPRGTHYVNCDTWTKTDNRPAPGFSSTMSYVFATGTSTAVQYAITATKNGEFLSSSVLTIDVWDTKDAIPATTWAIPKSWEPCSPALSLNNR